MSTVYGARLAALLTPLLIPIVSAPHHTTHHLPMCENRKRNLLFYAMSS